MKKLKWMCAAAALCLLQVPALADAGTCWKKSADNPVLNLGAGGNWDDYHVWDSSVLPAAGDGYQMWYSGSDGSTYRIGYATWNGVSENWQKWNKTGGPVLDRGPGGSWDDARIRSPSVLYLDGVYHMWYDGYDGSHRRIGYATSTDGLTWEKYNCDGGPVLDLGGSGEWDDHVVGNPSVLYDGAGFHMWYAGHDGSRWLGIGYATSVDGIVWTKHDGNGGPVLERGSGGEWDDDGVFSPAVLTTASGYEMWYTGYNGSHHRIGYAESPDGITWTKWYLNPVLNLGSGGSWDDDYVGHPSVYRDGQSNAYLWYSGYDGSHWRMGYATAELWVDITEPTGTLIIPASGGTFDYSFEVGNFTGSGKSGDMWVVLVHPDGSREDLRQMSGTAIECDVLPFSFVKNIPPTYQEGVYTLEVNIGTFPNFATRQDSVQFIKSPCD